MSVNDWIQPSKEVYDKLRAILTRQESVKLYVEFLKRNNKVDLLILKSTKVRSIVSHKRAC